MTTFKPDKIAKSINLLGRCDISDGVIIMDMTASGFEFCADFCGDITVSYDATKFGNRKIGLILDNFYNNMYTMLLSNKSGEATFRIAAVQGVHTVRMVKLSEYQEGGFCVNGISFDGEFLPPPKRPNLKFEFYGDSLTCGYGNVSPSRAAPRDIPNETNGYFTYCALLCRRFGADMSVASASGYGICISCDGDRRKIWREFADKLSVERLINWDFDRYKADVVFINLGTNDFEYCRNNPDFVISDDELHSELCAMLDMIRLHNPDCRFVFVCGVNGDMTLKNGNIAVERVYQRLCGEYDNAILIDKMHTGQQGANWHPNLDEHLSVANRLEKILCERMPDVFKL